MSIETVAPKSSKLLLQQGGGKWPGMPKIYRQSTKSLFFNNIKYFNCHNPKSTPFDTGRQVQKVVRPVPKINTTGLDQSLKSNYFLFTTSSCTGYLFYHIQLHSFHRVKHFTICCCSILSNPGRSDNVTASYFIC